jgi:branched-chain amino acid transport system substrate-binding protein
MRRLSGLLLAAALCIAVPRTGALAAPNGQPIEIPAILSLTGAAAFLGKSEMSALQLVEEQVNTEGGVFGRPLHFAVQDDQTNPQTALQLANGIIAKGAPIMIGPTLTAACGAILPLLKNGPVVYCLSPGMHPEKDSWMYSWGPITTDLVALNIKYYRDHGWKRIALLTTTDASGQDGEHSVDAALALPENKDMTLVAREHFNVSDLSVAAQVTRIKEAGAQALIAWGTGTPVGTAFHAIADAGLDIPVGITAGNILYTLLKQYSSILPKQLVSAAFPAAASEFPVPGPFANAVKRYNSAFATVGVRPDASQAIGWDPGWIIVGAYKKLGPSPTAEQLKQYLSKLSGFVGATGIYNFPAVPQRGISVSDSGLMVGWDPAKNAFVPLTKVGGSPK